MSNYDVAAIVIIDNPPFLTRATAIQPKNNMFNFDYVFFFFTVLEAPYLTFPSLFFLDTFSH